MVLSGGDDYELLFTADPAVAGALADIAAALDLPLTTIGRTTAGEGVTVLDAAGMPLRGIGFGGYRHF